MRNRSFIASMCNASVFFSLLLIFIAQSANAQAPANDESANTTQLILDQDGDYLSNGAEFSIANGTADAYALVEAALDAGLPPTGIWS